MLLWLLWYVLWLSSLPNANSFYGMYRDDFFCAIITYKVTLAACKIIESVEENKAKDWSMKEKKKEGKQVVEEELEDEKWWLDVWRECSEEMGWGAHLCIYLLTCPSQHHHLFYALHLIPFIPSFCFSMFILCCSVTFTLHTQRTRLLSFLSSPLKFSVLKAHVLPLCSITVLTSLI